MRVFWAKKCKLLAVSFLGLLTSHFQTERPYGNLHSSLLAYMLLILYCGEYSTDLSATSPILPITYNKSTTLLFDF